MNKDYPDNTFVPSDRNMPRTAIDEQDDIHFAAWIIVMEALCMSLFLMFLLGRYCCRSMMRTLKSPPESIDQTRPEENVRPPPPASLMILVKCHGDGTESNPGMSTSNTRDNLEKTPSRSQNEELEKRLKVVESTMKDMEKSLNPNEGWQLLNDIKDKLRDSEAQLAAQQHALEDEQSYTNGWKKKYNEERKAKGLLEREVETFRANRVSAAGERDAVAEERDVLRTKNFKLNSEIVLLRNKLSDSQAKSVIDLAAAERMEQARKKAETTIENESKIKSKLEKEVKKLEIINDSLRTRLKENAGPVQSQLEHKAQKEIADLHADNNRLKQEVTKARADAIGQAQRNEDLQKELKEARNDAIEQSKLHQKELTAEKKKQQNDEKEASDLKEKVKALRVELKEARQEVQTARSMNEASTQGADDVVKDLQKKITDLEKRVETLTQQRDSAQNKVTSQSDQIAELKSQQLPISEDDLSMKLEDARISIQDLEHKNKTLTFDKNFFNAENDDLIAKLKIADKEYDELKEQSESKLDKRQEESVKMSVASGKRESELANNLAKCQKRLGKVEDELEEYKKKAKPTSGSPEAPLADSSPSKAMPLHPFSNKNEIPDSSLSVEDHDVPPNRAYSPSLELPTEPLPRAIKRPTGARRARTIQPPHPPQMENRPPLTDSQPSITPKQPETNVSQGSPGASGVLSTPVPKQKEETKTRDAEDIRVSRPRDSMSHALTVFVKKKPEVQKELSQKEAGELNVGAVPTTKPPPASLPEATPAKFAPEGSGFEWIGGKGKNPVGKQFSQQPQASATAGSTTPSQPQPQSKSPLGAQVESFRFDLLAAGITPATVPVPETRAPPTVNFADTSKFLSGESKFNSRNRTSAPSFEVPASNTGTEQPNNQAPVHTSLPSQGAVATGAPHDEPATSVAPVDNAPEYVSSSSPDSLFYGSDTSVQMETIGTDNIEVQPDVPDPHIERLRRNQERAAKEEAEMQKKFGPQQMVYSEPNNGYIPGSGPVQVPITAGYSPYQPASTPFPGFAASGPATFGPSQLVFPGFGAHNAQMQNRNPTNVQGEPPQQPSWGGGRSSRQPPNETFANDENNRGSTYLVGNDLRMDWEETPSNPLAGPSRTSADTGVVNAGAAPGQGRPLTVDWLEEKIDAQPNNGGDDMELDAPEDVGNGGNANIGAAAAEDASRAPPLTAEELAERTRLFTEGWDEQDDEDNIDPRLEDDYVPP